MTRLTRRSFAKYLGFSVVSYPFLRTLQSHEAFGEVPRKKICIITHPEGHDINNWDETRSAILGTPLQQRTSFIRNIRLQSNGISHGAEQAILRAGTNESLDTFLEREHGIRALRLGLGINPSNPSSIVSHNEQGGAARILLDPMAAFQEVFGMNLALYNSVDRADLVRGKKSIMDPCLEDIKSLKNRLGSMSPIFDDYIYSLNEVYKKLRETAQPAPGGSSGSPVTAAQCSRENPAVGLNGAVEANFAAYVDATLDVAFQALACDAVQTVVLQFAHSESAMAYNFPNGPVSDPTGFHGAVIHGQGKSPTYQAVIRWYFSKVAAFARKMTEGGTDLLARSAIVHTSNAADPQAHTLDNVPMTIYGELGGLIKSGQTLDAPVGTSHHTILKTLVDGMLGPTVRFGEAGTSLPGLVQAT